MLKLALTLTLTAAAVPVSAQPLPAPPAGKVDKLVDSCRVYLKVAYDTNDSTALNAYVDLLLKDPRRNRDEIVACSAYILGAMDMAEGRVADTTPASSR